MLEISFATSIASRHASGDDASNRREDARNTRRAGYDRKSIRAGGKRVVRKRAGHSRPGNAQPHRACPTIDRESSDAVRLPALTGRVPPEYSLSWRSSAAEEVPLRHSLSAMSGTRPRLLPKRRSTDFPRARDVCGLRGLRADKFPPLENAQSCSGSVPTPTAGSQNRCCLSVG